MSRSFANLVTRNLTGCIAALSIFGQVPFARADVRTLHTYGNSRGHEVTNVIAVDASKLSPLLPQGYSIVPAASVGFGGPNQGIVVIANFQSIGPTVDGRKTGPDAQVAIDLAILVAEPPEAALAGVNISGAYHLYTLAIFTDDARYAASVEGTDMPIKFVDKIVYQRDMIDEIGSGSLMVRVPARSPVLFSISSSQGYVPLPGAFNAVFWHDGRGGHDRRGDKAVLHFLDQPFNEGNAVSRIYTKPHSALEALLTGGGLGPCDKDLQTGYSCIVAPSLNLRYSQGTVGTLQLIRGATADR